MCFRATVYLNIKSSRGPLSGVQGYQVVGNIYAVELNYFGWNIALYKNGHCGDIVTLKGLTTGEYLPVYLLIPTRGCRV